jgi:uncharacterized protein (DUF433 family)
MRPGAARDPLIHSVMTTRRGWPSIPLLGLAEASTARALRDAHLPMRVLVEAAEYIREHANDEFALASPKLVTDGTAAYLHDATTDDLTRLRDGQAAFVDVVRKHLRPLIPGDDGYVSQFRVMRFATSEVVIDPEMNTGRMYFTRTGVPLFVIAGALRAGEHPAIVAEDFDLTRDEVSEVESNLEWLEAVA